MRDLSADGRRQVLGSFGVRAPSRTLTADEVAARCPSPAKPGPMRASSSIATTIATAAWNASPACAGLTTQSIVGSTSLSDSPALGQFGLSADGSTIAFPTAQALVGADVNNGPDIYEWRNGWVGLITDGVSQLQERARRCRSVRRDRRHGAQRLFAAAAGR